MVENEKAKTSASEEDVIQTTSTGPLVFISHDSRDAELAEAFGKLLTSVSAGILKSFRSSDKKGKDGIDFGDEWYNRLMSKLNETTDVVCIFTERSLDRTWILFEAGVAKGKLNIPVFGIAMGVSLTRISTGPFYQFQNSDDSEDDLEKLVRQLAARITKIVLDPDVVKDRINAFKKTEKDILEKLSSRESKSGKQAIEENPVAKLVEEMKALPSRVAERLAASIEPIQRRRMRRFHPVMIEEILHLQNDPGDPVGILMVAGLIRDDAPWLYELVMEFYRAMKSGDLSAIQREMKRMQNFSELMMRSAFMEDIGLADKDSYIFFRELPRILDHMGRRMLDMKKTTLPRRIIKKKPEQQ